MHHMTHPIGDNTILNEERQTDQRNAGHLRHLRSGEPFAHRRNHLLGGLGISVGVVAAVIGLGIALPNSPSEPASSVELAGGSPPRSALLDGPTFDAAISDAVAAATTPELVEVASSDEGVAPAAGRPDGWFEVSVPPNGVGAVPPFVR